MTVTRVDDLLGRPLDDAVRLLVRHERRRARGRLERGVRRLGQELLSYLSESPSYEQPPISSIEYRALRSGSKKIE